MLLTSPELEGWVYSFSLGCFCSFCCLPTLEALLQFYGGLCTTAASPSPWGSWLENCIILHYPGLHCYPVAAFNSLFYSSKLGWNGNRECLCIVTKEWHHAKRNHSRRDPSLSVLPPHSPFFQPFPICFPTLEFCCFPGPFPTLFGGWMPVPQTHGVQQKELWLFLEKQELKWYFPIG